MIGSELSQLLSLFYSGNAYGRPVEESPAVHVPDFYCMAVMERDTCVPIVQEAFNDSDTGLRDAFTHYCRYGQETFDVFFKPFLYL